MRPILFSVLGLDIQTYGLSKALRRCWAPSCSDGPSSAWA